MAQPLFLWWPSLPQLRQTTTGMGFDYDAAAVMIVPCPAILPIFLNVIVRPRIDAVWYTLDFRQVDVGVLVRTSPG